MSDVLPDSRLQHHKKGITLGFHPYAGYINWEPIWCANCGQAQTFVPAENTRHAFWLCDNCFEKHGPIAGMMIVPDEVYWEQVRQDLEGKYQEDLQKGVIIP